MATRNPVEEIKENMKQVTAYHPVLGYTFIENIEVSAPAESGYYNIKTNSDGIRSDRNYTYKKTDSNIYRILVFGDSFTAADSVNNSQRFTDLLEKKIRGIEVINFGVSGYGTDQQLLMFKEKGLKYDFDLILVCPLLENIRRNTARYRLAIDRETANKILVPKPYFILQDNQLILNNVPVPQQRLQFNQATKEMLSKTDLGGPGGTYLAREFINRYPPILKPFLIMAIGRKVLPEYQNPKSTPWLLMAALIKEFKNIAGNKPLVVCPLPYYVQIEDIESSQAYLERFSSLDNGFDIKVVDIFGSFKQLNKYQKRQCRWKRDIHYTPFAHAIVADALYNEFKKINIIPNKCF